MRWALGVVVAVTSVAHADPLVRFGMTFGADRNAPEAHEVGPLIGVGLSSGRFSGEVNYTYLSFMDPETAIHRVGVALRASFVRCDYCTDPDAFYAEVGAARRMGHWRVADDIDATEQNEVYVAGGYELGRTWQIGLRFGLAQRDPMLGVACRGVGCPVAMPASSGLAESVMLEWMFQIGRSSHPMW